MDQVISRLAILEKWIKFLKDIWLEWISPVPSYISLIFFRAGRPSSSYTSHKNLTYIFLFFFQKNDFQPGQMARGRGCVRTSHRSGIGHALRAEVGWHQGPAHGFDRLPDSPPQDQHHRWVPELPAQHQVPRFVTCFNIL